MFAGERHMYPRIIAAAVEVIMDHREMHSVGLLASFRTQVEEAFPSSPTNIPETYDVLVRLYGQEQFTLVDLMQRLIGLFEGRPELFKSINGYLPPGYQFKLDRGGKVKSLIIDEGYGQRAVFFNQASITLLTPDDGLPYWKQSLTVRETIRSSRSRFKTCTASAERASKMSYDQIRNTRAQLKSQTFLLDIDWSRVSMPLMALKTWMEHRRTGNGDQSTQVKNSQVAELIDDLREATKHYDATIERCLAGLRLVPSKAGMPQYVRSLQGKYGSLKKCHLIALEKFVGDCEEERTAQDAMARDVT